LQERGPNELIVQIRAEEAAIDSHISGGGGLEGEEDPMADARVGKLHSEGWVVMVTGRQHHACRRSVVKAERINP
jgi:hypothetical protein